MRRPKWKLLAAALAVLLIAGWWFGSPWWTLWRMREAARAGDSETLAAYIDFPALRASTRAKLAPRLGPLGGALAGPAVDTLVSPAALRLALGSGRGGGESGADFDLDRTRASEFRLRRGDKDLVFRRHGLGWKLEEISLSSAR
jgi:hypothetical protein